jgi:hypothetical protein
MDIFWDRFKTSVHTNKTLTCAEKWEYLHQSVMDGPAEVSPIICDGQQWMSQHWFLIESLVIPCCTG